MFAIVTFSIVTALLVGVVVKFVLDRSDSEYEITWIEYCIGVVVISFIVVPLSVKLGWNAARDNRVTFNENLNGWELSPAWITIPCSRDGPCANEYNCDPYRCNCHEVCDSRDEDGSCTSSHEVCSTCYHDCPYVTEEWSFRVQSTIGTFSISEHRLPNNPNGMRWRRSVSVPQSVINSAGVGIPDFWRAVKARIDSGCPGPVMRRSSYQNYILASDRTIFHQYSSQVNTLVARNLLPRLQNGVHNFYYADRAYFVGFRPTDSNLWQKRLGYFNSALGSELQGDLHLVVVRNASLNPDEYTLALRAYWQNREIFERNSLSKNAVVVVLGTTNGERVEWARAFTGMPVGNEALPIVIQNQLRGTLLNPDSVIGEVVGQFNPGNSSVRGVRQSGALTRILWGLDNPTTRFRRVSMSGTNPNDVGGGFLYLRNEIQPTSGQKIGIFVITFICCMIVWLAFALIGARTWQRR